MVQSREQVDRFTSEGFFITDPMLDLELLDEIAHDFDSAREVMDRELDEKRSGLTTRGQRYFIPRMHQASEACKRLVTDAQLTGIAVDIVGPNVRLYWNQAVIKPAETGASFAWHQDSGYGVLEPLEYLTFWIPLDDATLENGCIWVIPGSHKRGLLQHIVDEDMGDEVGYRGQEEGIPVPVKRGQVVGFSSLMLHRSGPNTTEAPRRAYVVQYCTTETVSVETGEPWGDGLVVARGGRTGIWQFIGKIW